MPIVNIEKLNKNYITGSETLNVLKDFYLSISEGTKVVISGESGSGKTTLLNLMGGLDSPTSGKIFLFGQDITILNEDEITNYRKNMIGFIFQFHYLLKDFTAYENIMMPVFIKGNAGREEIERAAKLIEEVGLHNRQGAYPDELSGGERQRVAVARALMNNAHLILADEPTGNLDERNSSIVEKLLFELVEKYKKTLVLVTHDKHLAEQADFHYELQYGQLMER
jgi:lipoprotein-releasing system ATP-binding protein